MTEKDAENLKRLEQISESFRVVIIQRYSILSMTASLAAALLVIATFNEKLFPLTNFIRILISALLTCIILAIWGLILQTRDDLVKLEAMRNSIVKVNPSPKNSCETVLNYLPEIVSILLTLIIIIIIYLVLLSS